MYIEDIDLRYELKEKELYEFDDYVFSINSRKLKGLLEEILHCPVRKTTLYTDKLPFVLCVRVEDAFAERDLLEDIKGFGVTLEGGDDEQLQKASDRRWAGKGA